MVGNGRVGVACHDANRMRCAVKCYAGGMTSVARWQLAQEKCQQQSPRRTVESWTRWEALDVWCLAAGVCMCVSRDVRVP
jgi:hypothetical protein